MNINTVLLAIAALVPAIILCVYLYKKDKYEKEPKGLLIKLFFLGALSCYPAALLEDVITSAIRIIFDLLFIKGNINIGYINFIYFYNVCYYFIGIALVEEGLKWFILKRFAFDNKNFNCLFDGLIYAVFVSLGFAALENILYVTQYGWLNALSRAILSVPGHMFFSVMMGYYFSRWIILKEAKEVEIILKEEGMIPKEKVEFNYKGCKVMSLLIPVLLHGTYNFCLSLDSLVFTVIFLGFITFLYIFSFRMINKLSRSDRDIQTYSSRILHLKYPNLDIK